MKRRLIVPVLAVAALATAAPAHADADSYLRRLSEGNIVITDPVKALSLGYAVCNGAASGLSMQHEAAIIENNSDLSAYQSGWVVGSAMSNLCPSIQPIWSAGKTAYR